MPGESRGPPGFHLHFRPAAADSPDGPAGDPTDARLGPDTVPLRVGRGAAEWPPPRGEAERRGMLGGECAALAIVGKGRSGRTHPIYPASVAARDRPSTRRDIRRLVTMFGQVPENLCPLAEEAPHVVLEEQ